MVTGGAGFIGSHLVDRLLDEGHAVVVLDDLSTGRIQNLELAKGNPRLSIQRVDVSALSGTQSFFEGVDWVFHLAGLADIVPSIQRPLAYHRANVDGTVAVLEAARVAGVKRFVYAASSSCYGLAEQFPTSETAPMGPMYPYALTKYVGEQYVVHWGGLYDLQCVSLRLFNVFGPRSRTSGAYGAVFGVFLAQKLARKPYTVVGDGTQRRDFTFVADVVDAFVRAAESEVTGEVLNVGSGQPQTINYLVSLLGGDVVYVPRRPGEPDRTHADIDKISRLVGWQPKVSFEEGVDVMLRSIGQWSDAPLWDPESIAAATRDWFKYVSDAPQGKRVP